MITHELKTLEELAARFKHLSVTEDEFIYLKSVVLFKPGTFVLFNESKIHFIDIQRKNEVTEAKIRHSFFVYQ